MRASILYILFIDVKKSMLKSQGTAPSHCLVPPDAAAAGAPNA
jgi:hypothetical protein